VGDQGRAVGPDLTTIGRIRTGRDLLESVLYPNESLARDFETWNVTLSDGNEHLGLIQQESAEELLLITPAAEEITIPRDHIKSIEPIPLSIMPAGLEHSLPEDELIDLVSYLKSLK
jgi:putative heme-binding domain-containing protein